MTDSSQVHAGQAVYTRATLACYDLVVHGLSNPWIWRCPTQQLIASYNQHVTPSHLDLGVGTGLLLDRCRMPPSPRLVLVDLNEHCLQVTARRVARYHPNTHCRNVLEPLDLPAEEPFQSVGLHYLLHCLPGDILAKAAVFDHAIEYLVPGGVLFGSTLLSEGVDRGVAARALMRCYNRKGIFSNANDRLTDLEASLAHRFGECGVDVVGCAALFWGRIQAGQDAQRKCQRLVST